MSDWFGITLLGRDEGSLGAIVDRARAAGLEPTAVRAALLRGDGEGARFVELRLRLDRAVFDQHFDTLSTELVLRVLARDGRSPVLDELLGADWELDATVAPGLDDAPLAFVVSARDPAHVERPNDDGTVRDEWAELSVWVATRVVPWLADTRAGSRWGSAAFTAYDDLRDRYLARFPPTGAAVARWVRRIDVLRPRGDGWPSSGTYAVAPDGGRVMVVDDSVERIRVFDLTTGAAVRRWRTRYRTPADFIPFLAADPLAPRVIGNLRGGRIVERDWDGRRTRRLRTLEAAAGDDARPTYRFAPTGELVRFDDLGDATLAYGPRCVLYDRDTLQPVRVLAEHRPDPEHPARAIRCHGFAHAAPVGASGDGLGQVARWSLDRARPDWMVAIGSRAIASVALSPDGDTVWALDDDGWLTILAGDGTLRRRVHTHTSGQQAMVMAPDGATLVSADGQGVGFLDVASGEWVRHWFVPGSIPFQTQLDAVAFTAGGRRLCVATGGVALDVLELPPAAG